MEVFGGTLSDFYRVDLSGLRETVEQGIARCIKENHYWLLQERIL